MPHPLGFSETELGVITAAAQPIHPSAFVETVLAALVPHRVLGEGLVRYPMQLTAPGDPCV